jgi:hydroxymethylglutaryl-CoA lyase
MPNNIHLIECPRDAMQGWPHYIPTERKVEYISALMQVGFDTIDCGSFVSPKLIPQMADTKDVIKQLQPGNSKLLAIVANVRGAEEASEYDAISCIGFPFSVSETFQQRNTNSSIGQSLSRVDAIRNTCFKKGKQLVIYISMAFGNPYGDAYSKEIVFNWIKKIAAMDIKIISLADTVGMADKDNIYDITKFVIDLLPGTEIGVHLHSTALNWKEKIQASLDAGCGRFDGAIKGVGGCPMADDVLVGNMNTEYMISYFKELQILPAFNYEALERCVAMAEKIFQL